MAKDKGRRIVKIQGGETMQEANNGKDPESSKRLTEGNSCGLTSGAAEGGQRAGAQRPAAAAAATRSCCGSRCSGRRRRVCGCKGEMETAPPRRARAVSGAPWSSLPPLSAPPTPSLLLPLAPPPSAARSRARIYCKSELLGRSHTPTEGSSLEAAVVSVA